MAKQKGSRQSWWSLYTLVLLLVGLLLLAHYLAPSPGWRTFLEIGVVVVGYGVIMMWLETHSTALLRRPATEADSQMVELLEGEMSVLRSSPIQFYAGSNPVITYGLNSNGHHPVTIMPSPPGEASNN